MITDNNTTEETKKTKRRGPLKIAFRFILFFAVAAIAAYIGLAAYINTHKKEVLDQVTALLNEEINGTLTIGKMEPAFIQGFPRVSIRLHDVVVRDSLYHEHKHTLLKAGEVSLTVNTLALLRGTILIKKVSIENAAIDLYTTAGGYSTTSVFKKGNGRKEEGGAGDVPELKKFSLKNVKISIDNRSRSKLYQFTANEVFGKMDFTPDGWEADIELNALVHSLAFNTKKGSFIKNQIVEGDLAIEFSENKGIIEFKREKLVIGNEDFYIAAKFDTKNDPGAFGIHIENKKILWQNAANLLSPNITEKLVVYTLKEPIAVKCDIIGNFNLSGDPLIRVNAEVEENLLDTPGGKVDDCSFFGVFTNEHINGRGYTDENSAIKIYNFKGDYSGIPVVISKAVILDLTKPIITGNFTSAFEVSKLKTLIDEDLLTFSKGLANVELAFRADIVDFEFSKPLVQGFVKINDATVGYVPRNINFNDIDVVLNFTQDDLKISKIDLKSGKSAVEMEGSIKNFLNLYYTAPEKIVLDWEVYSPQLYLGDFISLLGNRRRAVTQKATAARKGNFTEDINSLFEKSNISMKVRVNKLFHKNFYAADARADVLLTARGLTIKNASLKHAGGVIGVDGQIMQGSKVNPYTFSATVANVNINQFFKAFDNFGMESLQGKNLKGSLSSKASLAGNITEAGTMMPKSMKGSLAFTLKNGALLNFEPVRRVGKFAFPNRDINNITFSNLNGTFDVRGEKVTIQPMQINTNVLNMDIEGIYSFGAGTAIYVDVPIRNPKRDEGITDEETLAKRRNRGIVLHLVAEDDEDGKVKVKLGSKRKD